MRIEFDDGVDDYLIDGANLIGIESIPQMLECEDIEIPKNLVSIQKMNITNNKKTYVHFYVQDQYFRKILKHTSNYVPLFQTFDGVIAPDPSFKIGKGRWFCVRSVWISRAVGYYLQTRGIKVIPNIRWGDKDTYSFCFLGVPKHSIVAISTVGAIRKDKCTANALRILFKNGLKEMLKQIEPTDVIVYGQMPADIFDEFKNDCRFHQFQSETYLSHMRE